jgi:PAS domain S-box-containing protein
VRKTDTLPYVAVSMGLSISAAIVAIRLAWLHPLPAVRVGALDVIAAAFWLLTSALDLTSSSLPVKLFLFQMRFFGIVLIPPCWLTLAMMISGYERWTNRRNISALSVTPIITVVLVFTNGYHSLMFSKVELNPVNPTLPLSLTYSLAFEVMVVGYSYAVLSVGTIILVRRLFLSRRSFRVQAYPLLIASSIPWLADMLYLYDQNLFGYVEPTSLTLTLAGMIVLWRMVDWPGLYIAPVAHEVLIDSMSDLVIVLDYEGRVVDMNPMALGLIGRSYSDVVGQPIMSTWPEWPRIAKVLDNKTLGTKEVSSGTDDKMRYYEVESTRLPGFTSDEINLLIILRDVTKRKILEEKLRLYSEQLKQYSEHLEDLVEERTKALREAERMAAIGEAAAMVGHDLRNPLQAMTNTLYLVKRLAASEKVEDRKEAAGLLGKLNDSIQYMDKIVSDLQDYTRPVGADLVETSLADLVRTTVSNVKIPENVEVAMNVEDGLPNVKLDPALFRRVLTNLILNAIQAMPKGGKTTITSSRGDESFTVAVQDTGVGIAPENLEKVFKPFFTTKAQGQGLGLAVCKRLIEAQSGTITVTSQVQKGSTFTLTMPTKRTGGTMGAAGYMGATQLASEAHSSRR